MLFPEVVHGLSRSFRLLVLGGVGVTQMTHLGQSTLQHLVLGA